MKRILVVLPNWFGETLFATPFLRALRQQRPQAFLAALGWPQCRDILQHSPHIDAILTLDEQATHRGLLGTWRLVRMLQRQRFDTAFILRKSLTRTMVTVLAGIPTRVGVANAKSGWLLTHRSAAPSWPQHKALSYLPLLEAVGLSAVAWPYEYTVTEEERAQASQRLQAIGAGGPWVMLHPGANWPHKRWAAERFARLGDRLITTHAARIIVTGSPQDVPLARQVAAAMPHAPTLFAGQTSLRELAACLEQAQLVVTNDTGVLHLTAALRRPLLALYGPTSPLITGPLGDPHRMIVLHHADCCPRIPCYAPDRPPHPGMNSISVDEAHEAACKLLEIRPET